MLEEVGQLGHEELFGLVFGLALRRRLGRGVRGLADVLLFLLLVLDQGSDHREELFDLVDGIERLPGAEDRLDDAERHVLPAAPRQVVDQVREEAQFEDTPEADRRGDRRRQGQGQDALELLGLVLVQGRPLLLLSFPPFRGAGVTTHPGLLLVVRSEDRRAGGEAVVDVVEAPGVALDGEVEEGGLQPEELRQVDGLALVALIFEQLVGARVEGLEGVGGRFVVVLRAGLGGVAGAGGEALHHRL
mmetsp:Transcript_37782/g.121237  ORF Transcript_37782/g.121237 Transcript_37782/m.121237 type:complete len:246 (+) Transcript_37782:1185-1922(+)